MFRLTSDFPPRGDQPSAIGQLTAHVRAGRPHSVLRGVVVVASVSCIYGIGAPETYQQMHLSIREGERIDRDEIIRRLVAVQYERNDYDFHRGTFRVRGDIVEVFPANEESLAIRVELFGDEVDALHRIDPLKGSVLERLEHVHVYPASHYVTEASQLERAL